MNRSSQRLLTTHTGSLPRPAALRELMIAAETEAIAPAQLQECTRAAVAEVVQRQVSTGIDVVNDGEASKFNYATYVQERLTGFGGHSIPKEMPDVLDFPQFAERIRKSRPRSHFNRPACVGPIAVRDADAVHRDIANIRAALDSLQPADAFLTAASPGVVSYFFDNTIIPRTRRTCTHWRTR